MSKNVKNQRIWRKKNLFFFKNVWTDADSRTNTILKRLHDLAHKKNGGAGGGGEGLTNERLGSEHVIWGPMRGFKKIALGGDNTQTDRQTLQLLERIGLRIDSLKMINDQIISDPLQDQLKVGALFEAWFATKIPSLSQPFSR